MVSIFFSGNILHSQIFKVTESVSSFSGFNSETSQENFLLNQVAVNSNIYLTSDSNSIYLSQIGNNNNLVSTTTALESNIVIIQNGNQNNTILDLNGAKLKETVLQNGDNNTFLDYSLFKTMERNVEVNQTGDNQNLTMFGSNSLSEKMKISMQGQDQSIIIRNF
jgi:hypothetical protein